MSEKAFEIDLEPYAYKIWWQSVIYRTQKKKEQALEYLAQAAGMGETFAQYELGRAYENGDGIPKDMRKAIAWYNRSKKNARWGDTKAEDRLAELRSKNKKLFADGIPDMPATEETFERGMELYEKKMYKKAYPFLWEAAILGHVDARNQLAKMFAEGVGVAADSEKANYWYLRAENQGKEKNPLPDTDETWDKDFEDEIFLKGREYKFNEEDEKAVEYLADAAQRGIGMAQFYLAGYYQSYANKGIFEKNEGKRIAWLIKSAEYGISLACQSMQSDRVIRYIVENGIPSVPPVEEAYEQAVKYFEAGDYEQARMFFHEAASFGHYDAQITLARMYEEGKGVEKNPEEAVHWYDKAAENKKSYRENWEKDLDMVWERGIVFEKDGEKKKAVQCFAYAALRGHVHSQYELGRSYENGTGFNADPAKAVSWYSRAADQGDMLSKKHLEELRETKSTLFLGRIPEIRTPEETYELGLINLICGSGDQAYGSIEEAALFGHPLARRLLSRLPVPKKRSGEGTVEYVFPASEDLACMNKDAVSGEDLDEIWIKGTNYYQFRNLRRAMECYAYAALRGNAYCQYEVGNAYKNGLELSRDGQKAAAWYLKALEQGHVLAGNQLKVLEEQGMMTSASVNSQTPDMGKLYEQGMSFIEKGEPESAVPCLLEAAIFEHVDAQFNLGRMYDEGVGVKQNKEEAVHWYQRAAGLGHADAQNDLAYMYESGEGVEKNPKEAVKWYLASAKQGNPIAQCNLANLYRWGIGCETNKKEAFRWFSEAADQGDDQAYRMMKQMSKNKEV